jgi:hypothetical protein
VQLRFRKPQKLASKNKHRRVRPIDAGSTRTGIADNASKRLIAARPRKHSAFGALVSFIEVPQSIVVPL